MDFNLGRSDSSVQTPSILVLFSVDGARLHSTAGGVFGFLRVLNMVS